MNAHYKNFKTVVYMPAWSTAGLTPEKLEADYGFLEKYIGLDKVYLETHRGGMDVPEEKLRMIKSFLEERGVTVSGGITTTIDDFEGAECGKRRLFNTFCYTDPAMRKRMKDISEYAAGIFDEIILDDFFFTNCSCERCIKEKGDRSWADFRRDLMRDVSRNLIVDPAKAVNPNVRMIIKYPNWRESFHYTGYVPEAQDDIFDATYIGTETRSPSYTDQHLPEYLSYSLVRFMENAWPGRCGGGWFDTYSCWSADRYLEQAYLTAFAGAKELMHFQWSDLIDNPFVCAMGVQLKKIDRMLDKTGSPVGIPVYIPHASCGENHFEMRLGMCGIPMEPTPCFPEKAPKLLLTESSASDPGIVDKLMRFVSDGGDAVITSGFLAKCGDELRRLGLTEAAVSGRKYAVTRYQITGDFGGYAEHCSPVIFPEITHGNNESWSLLNGGSGDKHFSLFLRSTYGRGRLYILAVPDNDAEICLIPDSAMDVIRRGFVDAGNDTYITGENTSLFTYDDGSMILYRYVKPDLHPGHVIFHTSKEVRELMDLESGRTMPAIKKVFHEDFGMVTEWVADVIADPGRIYCYKWA